MITASPIREQIKDTLSLLLYVNLLLLLFGFAWGMDALFAATLSPTFDGIMVGAAALVSLPFLLTRKRRRGVVGLAAFAGALFLLACMNQSPKKAVYRIHDTLRVGMSRREVFHLIETHFPKGGRFGPPNLFQEGPSFPGEGYYVVVDGLLIDFTQEGRTTSWKLLDDWN